MTTASAAPAAASEKSLVRGPTGAHVKIAPLNGLGCPANSVDVALTSTNDAFTVTYYRYIVLTGGSSVPADARKNCQISLKVHVPQGFTYAISSTTYRGCFFAVDSTDGNIKTTYHLAWKTCP